MTELPRFPYTPYSVQQDFMRTLYQTLDKGGIGIFESPTGTGKSLSLICTAVDWLLKNPVPKETNTSSVSTTAAMPAWVTNFATERKVNEHKRREEEITEQLQQTLSRASSLTSKSLNKLERLHQQVQRSSKKARVNNKMNEDNDDDDDDDDLIVEDYGGSSAAVVAEDDDLSSDDDAIDLIDNPSIRKIIYCTRTHSQVAQFIHEIEKTDYVSQVRVVPLASRQKMCIHSTVSKLKSSSLVNATCLDMNKTKKTRCVYHTNKKVQSVLAASALMKIQDIEDLVACGKQMQCCPYYAAREATTLAHVVAIPYSSLFHKSTRSSLGVDIKNNIIIVDEAHNLVDVISQLHEAQLSLQQIVFIFDELSKYQTRYKARLNPANYSNISQILAILDSIRNYLMQLSENTTKDNESMCIQINQFIFDAKLTNADFVELMDYLENSTIVQKLHAHYEKYNDQQQQQLHSTSVLQPLADFISSLTNKNDDAVMLITKSKENPRLRFVLLNASEPMSQVISEAHAVILAGGTLNPITLLQHQLFPSVDPSQIVQFSCGHVVNEENYLCLCISQGPTGVPIDLSYRNRHDENQMIEAGRIVANLVSQVPDGIVVFFPSYSMEDQMLSLWTKASIMERITKKKKPFYEPKDATMVDTVLQSYSQHIQTPDDGTTGAILFCVVNGKLSEGINFSDKLGRCVVMIGVPFPNPKDELLQQKMSFVNRLTQTQNAGNEMIEDLCMQAVNQSIGRSIRHINDYSCIVLVDARYRRENLRSKVSAWIRKRFVDCQSYSDAYKAVAQFFKAKNDVFIIKDK